MNKEDSTKNDWKYLLIVILFFFGMIYIIAYTAQAVPDITAYDNSITGDDSLYPHIEEDNYIRFNVTINESVNYSWYKDDDSISNNFDNYSTSWSSPGYKNISVYGTNANGSTSLQSWHPWVNQKRATGSNEITPIDTTPYNNMMSFFESDEPDVENFFSAMTTPHTSLYGNLFYVLLYGLPFVFIWLFQGSAKIPAVLGVILGPLFLSYFNPEYVPLSILFIILTFVGIIYTIYKERG